MEELLAPVTEVGRDCGQGNKQAWVHLLDICVKFPICGSGWPGRPLLYRPGNWNSLRLNREVSMWSSRDVLPVLGPRDCRCGNPEGEKEEKAGRMGFLEFSNSRK